MGIVAEIFADELNRLEAAGQIETVGRLKIFREGPTGPSALCFVKIWKGKAKRPAYYSFRSVGLREQYICRELEAERARDAAGKQRKERDAAELARFLESIQVGTLLHYSWGYDQTNCEFFQVTERRGRLVTIRAIDGEVMPGGGDMSGRMRPKRDAFLVGTQAETLTKRIGPGGISMSFGHASPCGETDTFHFSSYA